MSLSFGFPVAIGRSHGGLGYGFPRWITLGDASVILLTGIIRGISIAGPKAQYKVEVVSWLVV